MSDSAEQKHNFIVTGFRLLRWPIRGLIWLALLIMTGWSVLAIYYSNLPSALRPICAGVFAAAVLGVLLFVRPKWKKLAVLAAMFALLICWWLTIPPSNDRDWQPDVAILPSADINGSRVTIHNIRNCDYRTETNYEVRHYDKTFDLDRLQSADLFLSYWGSPKICHTMMSFGFGRDGYVCISIETRKEKGEAYSTVKGFFRQYELTYVVADERDLVRLRTNFRGEHVYLYRLNAKPDVMRNVFLDYLKAVNSLKVRPEWYNALTGNCTSTIRGHTQPYTGNTTWSWKLVINGYIDELAYDKGALYGAIPFVELKRLSLINDRAKAADKDSDFSKRIREGLPGINQ